DPERIAQRLAKADEEVTLAADLPYTMVLNDDLDRAVAEVEALVARARASR
ncbi:MAG: guanylate kinase, partial [Actinomycetia bacterium]|nr:guanylate kinase [Actinomycetes bacterium]